MTSVPFLDLQAAYLELRDEIDAATARVLASGWYIQGTEVEAFEADFASFCGAAHCVGLGNGLDALILALRALGIGPGDEVIVPSNTFIATWLAVSAVGARPVPVEPAAPGFNMDAAGVAAAIGPRTKAVIPVHLYGQPAAIGPIVALARNHGLFVVEDAAQAHGARVDGTRIGGHGDIVCWSFYPGKNLGALGDGGAITTNDATLADRIRTLANYGSREKYVHELRGVNSRLDPVQAAILRVKLMHLEAWNARRGDVANRYTERLTPTPLVLPAVQPGHTPVWHLFVVRSHEREALQAALSRQGIGTLIHYPVPPHMQAAYADLGIAPEALPIARDMARQVLSLPIGPHLAPDQIERTIEAVAAFYR